MRARRAWRSATVWALLASLVAATALSGCAATVPGTGRGTRPPEFSPAALAALLEPAPPASHAWPGRWGRTTTPTVNQLVERLYRRAFRKQALSGLRADRVTAIAHRTWNAPDTNGIDLILLAFASRRGAADHFYTAASQLTQDLDVDSFPFDSRYRLDRVRGFVEKERDADGDVRAYVFACLPGSRIVLEAFSFSTARFDAADVRKWVGAQLDRVR